jgi:signal transduction histidine kinase
MIILFLFLLVFLVPAFIILFFGPRFRFIRLAGLIAFVNAFTPLAEILEKFILPQVSENTLWFHLTLVVIGYFYTLAYYIYPCLLLLFSLIYSKLIKEGKLLYLLVFIPVYWMYFFSPLNLTTLPPVPATILQFGILKLWAVPYIVIANCILLYSFIRETNSVLKKQALANFVIIVFPTIFGLFLGYLYPEMIRNDFWRTIQIISVIVPYLFFLNRYGAFGVKMHLEKDLYEHNIQLISHGASFMNHTVKNEASKIKACLTLLEYRSEKDTKGLEYLNIISRSLDQILSVTELIQAKTQVFDIQPEQADLQLIVNEVLQGFAGLLETKNIMVNQKHADVGNISVDITHIREVISNIIVNAIEAMPNGGLLSIESYQRKKSTFLTLHDTGTGIAEEDLMKVIEPFYSTKKGQNNFGLGLTYCYNVMQEHGGELVLRSAVGEGTTVFLKFPSVSKKGVRRISI